MLELALTLTYRMNPPKYLDFMLPAMKPDDEDGSNPPGATF